MPRPKGSKNKKNLVVTESSIELLKSRIADTEAEIGKLSDQLKAKNTELKSLKKDLAVAIEAEARAKLEADKERLLSAVAASGKSVDEILALLK